MNYERYLKDTSQLSNTEYNAISESAMQLLVTPYSEIPNLGNRPKSFSTKLRHGSDDRDFRIASKILKDSLSSPNGLKDVYVSAYVSVDSSKSFEELYMPQAGFYMADPIMLPRETIEFYAANPQQLLVDYDPRAIMFDFLYPSNEAGQIQEENEK